MPSQTFRHSTLAAVPPQRVWETFDDPKTWESIGGIDRVYDARIGTTGRLEGFTFDTEVGGKKYVGTATPGQRVDQRLIGWQVENSEIKGLILVEITDEAGDTRIDVSLDVRSASLMSGMFFPVIANTIGSGLPAAVDRFAQSFVV